MFAATEPPLLGDPSSGAVCIVSTKADNSNSVLTLCSIIYRVRIYHGFLVVLALAVWYLLQQSCC